MPKGGIHRNEKLTLLRPVDKDFSLSIDLYTDAIALNPKDSTFWNNRAMSKAKLEEHGGAIADASE
jgi:serine/threonine-protein phosphatase 5